MELPPHFDRLRSELSLRGWEENHATLTIDRRSLVALVRRLLEAVPFDEEWYCRTYPDVKAAIEKGDLPSGKAHYLHFGYFEGRLPGMSHFDPRTYCSLNPDIAAAFKGPDWEKQVQSHYMRHGYREGRPAREGPNWLNEDE